MSAPSAPAPGGGPSGDEECNVPGEVWGTLYNVSASNPFRGRPGNIPPSVGGVPGPARSYWTPNKRACVTDVTEGQNNARRGMPPGWPVSPVQAEKYPEGIMGS